MTARRKNRSQPAPKAETPARDKPAAPSRLKLAAPTLWLFRAVLALGTPLLFFAVVEAGLRLAGFGHPAGFLLPSTNAGVPTFVQNTRFGWRFFGARMARTPQPISISRVKPAKTIRVFVLGESAAQGDPQPQFGLPRMLQAMLGLRHPEFHFEVVNAAMTAINSHTILPIARDCARADGDLWVVYMGNNEVVGPFGAGTVFGPKTAALPLIRANLALKTTRAGQWLDSLRQRSTKAAQEEDQEWGGMAMFLQQQVGAGDPRLSTVYDNFSRNLADIIRAGTRAGVGVVVGTVAVNLRDCAPFASEHRSDLPAPEKARWDQLCRQGIAAQKEAKFAEAAARFSEASRIDDTVAELRFRQAVCALSLEQRDEARRDFVAARDLDTLRFRCDSKLNGLIADIASAREKERVLLADAEKAFADQSPDGLPGEALFYEHVHLTFEGNYLLAKTIAAQLEKLLPHQTEAPGSRDQAWPSPADCARRLAWTDYNRRAGLSEILGRLSAAPFTGQLNHEEQILRLNDKLARLAPAAQAAGIREAVRACEAALRESPDDPRLMAQLAVSQEASGDLPGATVQARHALELLPSSGGEWAQLGLLLARQNQFEEAASAFRRSFELDPQDVWALQNLAQALDKMGRQDEAMKEYRRAVAIKPRFGSAWLGLGQILEATGKKNEAAGCFQKALANPVQYAPELVMLARFCRNRSWLAEAATNYADALKLTPADATLHFELGQDLEALGRKSEAAEHYADAVRLDPEKGEARFLLGLMLGQQGKPAAAEEQFREAARLLPNLLETRINLGIALFQLGRREEARAQFDLVLQRSPTNAVALRYRQILESPPAAARVIKQ